MSASKTGKRDRRAIKIIRLLLLAVCVVLFIRMLRTPYEPGVLYRAVPADAFFVSMHERPLESWMMFSTNAVVVDLLERLDPGDQDYAALWDSGVMRSIMGRSVKQEAVISYVPSVGGSGEPALFAAAWIGGMSYCLRGMFFLRQVPGFRALGNYAGWSIWGMDEPLSDTGMRVSAAVGTGILFLCVSRLPAGVKYALAAYEGLTPSAESEQQFSVLSDASAADKGWIRSDAFVVSYQAGHADAGSLTLDLRVHADMPEQLPLFDGADIEFPDRLLGDLPAILTAFPLSGALDFLQGASNMAWAGLILDILGSDELLPERNGLIFAVLTDEYSGRYGTALLRMRVPAVLMMLQTGRADTSEMVNNLLDGLNAEYRKGLIVDPSPIPIGDYRLRRLESVTDNMLAGLNADDRPAFAQCGNWFVVCSNARSLSALLTRVQNPMTEFGQGGWFRKLEDEETAALLWINLESGVKSLQLPLVLLSMQTASSKPAVSEWTAKARTWLETIRGMGTCSFQLLPDSDQPVVRMTIQGVK